MTGTIFEQAQARLDYQRKSEKLLGPVSADIEKRLHEYAKAPRPPKKDWKPCPTEDDFEKRLKPLINQIINAGEQKTGIKVPRGEDGCPFPGEEEDMPEGWGYWMCCVWFGRRLTRLWLWCNGRWVSFVPRPCSSPGYTALCSACVVWRASLGTFESSISAASSSRMNATGSK